MKCYDHLRNNFGSLESTFDRAKEQGNNQRCHYSDGLEELESTERDDAATSGWPSFISGLHWHKASGGQASHHPGLPRWEHD